MSCLNYGEGPPPPSHRHLGADEAAYERATSKATLHCDDMYRSLVGGDIFLAERGESPRARELLTNECGTPSPEQRVRADRLPQLKPLGDTNPALCARMKTEVRPEGFALRYEGRTLYWYYFSYVRIGGRIHPLDLYSKIPVEAPFENASCEPTPTGGDTGSAPVSGTAELPCRWIPSLNAYDEKRDSYYRDVVTVWGCYGGRTTFRRATESLEVDAHDG
jgi:hypothetical protein